MSTLHVSWERLLKVLKNTHYWNGPGLSLLQENIRRLWYERMVTRTESSFFINGPVDALEYYPRLLGLQNEHLPLSIANIAPHNHVQLSDNLKPIRSFGPEMCFSFLHLCPQSTVNTTYDQLVNVRLSWWKQLCYNSSNFTLSNLEESDTILSGRCIQYNFPWGLETVETVCNLGDKNLKNVETQTKAKCESRHGKKLLNPRQIQCEMTLGKATALFLKDAYEEKSHDKDAYKQVFHLNPRLAPFKVAVCRYGSRSEEINEVTTYITTGLRSDGHQILDNYSSCELDKQLTMFDEMGIPFTVIVSDSTIETGTIKLRNRDTALQETIAIGDLLLHVNKYVTYQPPNG